MVNHPNRSEQQQAKHTPAPWRVRSVPQQISGDEGDKLWWYSFEAKADKGTFAEHEANAALMQSAPKIVAERDRLKSLNAELLEALEECQAAIRDYRLQLGDRIRLPNDIINHASYALKIADEAIAKTEGR